MDTPNTDAAARFADRNRELRQATRKRAYGFLRINTAAIRAAFEHVETPIFNGPPIRRRTLPSV